MNTTKHECGNGTFELDEIEAMRNWLFDNFTDLEDEIADLDLKSVVHSINRYYFKGIEGWLNSPMHEEEGHRPLICEVAEARYGECWRGR